MHEPKTEALRLEIKQAGIPCDQEPQALELLGTGFSLGTLLALWRKYAYLGPVVWEFIKDVRDAMAGREVPPATPATPEPTDPFANG